MSEKLFGANKEAKNDAGETPKDYIRFLDDTHLKEKLYILFRK